MSELSDTKRDIIDAYRDGSKLTYIAEQFNTSQEDIRSILLNLKELSRFKRTFTDEFKTIIAERDMSGISRRQISLELGINANTVKKACEQFGQPVKDRGSAPEEYDKILGNFKSECPSCNSKDINNVDKSSIYCMACGDEHELRDGYALRVKWEYLD